VRAAPL